MAYVSETCMRYIDIKGTNLYTSIKYRYQNSIQPGMEAPVAGYGNVSYLYMVISHGVTSSMRFHKSDDI